MEFEKRKVPTTDTFRAFISKYKSNPLTKKKIVVAKDSSYPYEKSEDAYVLLLPLALKDLYMYVQPYVDSKTDLTEYCLKIGKISDLTLLHGQTYTFNGSRQEDIRLNKGVRYVEFLADFFDPEKNKVLYKHAKNSRTMVVERKVKYDSDKVEYQEKSGYLEVQHLRVHNEGSLLNYVQILCVRAYKGERSPATLSAFLDGEWRYLSKYLNFVVRFYKLTEVGMTGGLQKKRIETIRRDVMQAVELIEKDRKKATTKIDGEKINEGTSVEDGLSSSKKRKVSKNDNGTKPVKVASKKDSLVIDDDCDSDKENTPSNDATSYIEMDVDQEILDSVKNIVPDAKEDGEQVKNDNNNSDSDWAENDNIYN